MTPELRALQDELHERLAGPVDHQQSTQDTRRDWADIRAVYAHHVDRANASRVPLGPLRAPLISRDQAEALTAPLVGLAQAVQNAAPAIRTAMDGLAQSIAQTAPTQPVNTGPAGWLRRWWSR